MTVSITIDGHTFQGGPDAHKGYNTITGEVLCAAPYTPGGELFGAAELQAAIQALLGRTDRSASITAVRHLAVYESSEEDAFFRMNAAGTRLMAFNQPAASLTAGTASTVPTVTWDGPHVVALDTVALPAGIVAGVHVTASGAAVGPYGMMSTAAVAASNVQIDLAGGDANFLAADAVTECYFLLIDPGAASVPSTIDGDATPVEYGAVDISTITTKFVAVVV